MEQDTQYLRPRSEMRAAVARVEAARVAEEAAKLARHKARRATPKETYRGLPELIDKKIGQIVVIRFHRKGKHRRNSIYECLCKCGKKVYRREHWLKNPRNDGYDKCVECQKK